MADRGTIWVIAGPNGAGKSSVAGAFLRSRGGDYFNPDEVASRIRRQRRGASVERANALAWEEGYRQLQSAIQNAQDYYFETTLGGNSIASALEVAIRNQLDVRVWYVALGSPALHVARVTSRVKSGGHAIPEYLIRERYDNSRRNLIRLLPGLKELRVFDNSHEADPAGGSTPLPRLILHTLDGIIQAPSNLTETPEWAKPIVAAALKNSRQS